MNTPMTGTELKTLAKAKQYNLSEIDTKNLNQEFSRQGSLESDTDQAGEGLSYLDSQELQA